MDFIIPAILGLIVYWTGELALWAATFGRRRPRWAPDDDNPNETTLVLGEASFYLGLVVWISIISLITTVA